jgi:quinol monooxygenase YgiN
MIYVVATTECKPGRALEFLACLKRYAETVRREPGCLLFQPCMDHDSGLPAQKGVRPDAVVLVEQWESMDALRAHLATDAMKAYQAETKDLWEAKNLQVLEPA